MMECVWHGGATRMGLATVLRRLGGSLLLALLFTGCETAVPATTQDGTSVLRRLPTTRQDALEDVAVQDVTNDVVSADLVAQDVPPRDLPSRDVVA